MVYGVGMGEEDEVEPALKTINVNIWGVIGNQVMAIG